jgi:CheY-like chemotaxis protein
MNILIAEDEPVLRDMIVQALEEHGVQTRASHNGQEAILELEKQLPDILLLDLLMPKVDGYGVLQYVNEKGWDLSVIVLSNLSDPKEEEKCREWGAKDFLVKSNLDEEELWGKIQSWYRG